ncbi:DNA polymerase IV [Legionella fallonii]|uniref:DNA polymerase IV n=1 Tax=Legionella fallonii TaxID=96230 RepID=UPI0038B37697
MTTPRKIIHIDMDCFYAAIEIRDNPLLNNKPVAVGGSANQRGVLCTCNYIARQFGIHSAMPTAKAYRLCPSLIVLPVNMSKYREVSLSIKNIFHQFTDLVEPLALDEAFLDVTNSPHCQGSATLMAQAIQKKIFTEHQLTASAGVAPNKFLAKIASAWKKPNGLFVITPAQVSEFVKALPINKLFGVGKVTTLKLNQLNIFTCNDLYQYSLEFLIKHFGKLGQQLYYQSRGIDNRAIQPHRLRKSLSVERTLQSDIVDPQEAINIIRQLYETLIIRIQEYAADLLIKNQFIKVKTSDFKLASAEIKSGQLNLEYYLELFQKISLSHSKPIRLLGIGVHFQHDLAEEPYHQPSLFSNEDDVDS